VAFHRPFLSFGRGLWGLRSEAAPRSPGSVGRFG
jgi:hypothetical protein